jgi:hypothetical protein
MAGSSTSTLTMPVMTGGAGADASSTADVGVDDRAQTLTISVMTDNDHFRCVSDDHTSDGHIADKRMSSMIQWRQWVSPIHSHSNILQNIYISVRSRRCAAIADVAVARREALTTLAKTVRALQVVIASAVTFLR